VTTAIRKHLRDFLAIVVLLVIALAVVGYILSNQRVTVPAWVPVVGQDFYEVEAEFTTAQAVTPGQGQTVQIAGVDIGQISKVELEDGKGVVTLRIEPEHDRVYRDATALLRPKTGLKDMVVELVPGTPEAGRLDEGERIPVGQTLPDVNLDEILASLDDDTRQYVQLLVSGAAEGLRGNGRRLASALRRFEPVNRDLLEINGELTTRRQSIRRVMHNLSLLTEELGSKDDQLARFVETSNQFFEALAAEDDSLRAALAELPGALTETERALGKTRVLASELGPTLQGLRPAARALGPALRRTQPFLRASTPVIRDQLRPFARDAQAPVAALRPALNDLAATTPKLSTSFKVVNALLNTLAYNPPGPDDEGYLFWLAWANHLAPALFGAQDAHGPIRRGVVVSSCNSFSVLANLARVNAQLGTLVGLLNAPDLQEICPTTSQGAG
jgi:phospholipid/cholesterol/gamma-HCH transport system substrate-binding protein